jgi:hypothetical protein
MPRRLAAAILDEQFLLLLAKRRDGRHLDRQRGDG